MEERHGARLRRRERRGGDCRRQEGGVGGEWVGRGQGAGAVCGAESWGDGMGGFDESGCGRDQPPQAAAADPPRDLTPSPPLAQAPPSSWLVHSPQEKKRTVSVAQRSFSAKGPLSSKRSSM